MKKGTLKEVPRAGLRIFGYTLAFGFIGFMLVPSLIGLTDALRIPLIGLLIVAAILLLFMDASYRGARDCAMSETLRKLSAKGAYSPTAAEVAKQYNPLKGILSALLGALPLLLCAVIVAVMAKPYAYAIQDLPAWITPYLDRPEIGNALQYMQGASATAGIVDYLRIAVRFLLFPYVGLFGSMGDDLSLMFDRIAPLFALVLPLASAIGYLYGPIRHKREAAAIQAVKSTPRKRLKKDRNKGNNGPKEKKQLI